MKYTISKDRRMLTISTDKKERKLLREGWDNPGETNIQSDKAMHDFFEHLTCNSELEWIDPADTGDLTAAPMLGILGNEVPDTANIFEEIKRESYGMIQCGQNGQRKYFQPILERWIFADYALRSPLENLRDTGNAVFTNGE